MKNHTLLLAGNGSYSNRGCEAIVRGTTRLVRENKGEYRFLSNYFPSEGCRDEQLETDPAIVHRPFPLLQRYSLPWFEDQVTRKVFHQPYNIRRVSRIFRRSMQEAEAVLMLGGDNFSLDYPDVEVHFRLCQLALERKLPVFIWGASVGPFSQKPAFEQWAALELRRLTRIFARETLTVEYLSGIGVKGNVFLTADPAFYLQPSACRLPDPIEKLLSAGCIGINLSPLLRRFIKVSGAGLDLSTWVDTAVSIVRSILQHFTVPVLLVPHVTSETGDIFRDDYLFLKSVAKAINEPQSVLALGPGYNAAQTKWIISRTRIFAGARTHSTLAAISSCVPTICIGYSMKARGIAQDVYGHLDWLISGQELVKDAACLKDRLASMISQEAAVRNQLECVNPELQQRAQAAAGVLAEMISE